MLSTCYVGISIKYASLSRKPFVYYVYRIMYYFEYLTNFFVCFFYVLTTPGQDIYKDGAEGRDLVQGGKAEA